MPGGDSRLGRSGRQLCAGVALATMLLSDGCALQEYRFEKHLERAERYMAHDQVDLALIELHSALAIHPEHPEVNFEVAELQNGRRNPAEAKFYYGEANRHDPDNVEAAVKYALLVLAQDPYKGGQLIERAAELEPKNPWGQLGLSELALVEGDTDWALHAAREAIRLDRDSPVLRWQLARVHFAQIRELALENAPIPDALLGNAQLAIAAYVSRANDGPRGALEFARVLSQVRGRGEAATRWFSVALNATAKLEDQPQLRLFAVQEGLKFARDTKQRPLEFQASRLWVDAEPENLAAWSQLAKISRLLGSSERKVYEELLEKRPEDAGAYMLIAREQVDERGMDWATTFLREAADAGIDPPELLGMLADLQLRDGRNVEWEATSLRLVEQHPLHPRGKLARAHLALARPEPGQSAKEAASLAVEILRRLVEHSESALALHLLGSAESQLENHARALVAIERAIELGGASLELDRTHARILHDAGHWQFALAGLLRVSSKTELSNAEKVMLARCAYRAGKEEFARQSLMALLRQDDAPTAAAIELAEHEIPSAELQPKIIAILDAELESASHDPRALALATALDLENGQRARAIRRLLRQIDREIAIGVQAQQRGRGLRESGDESSAQQSFGRTDEVRSRLTGLTRYAATLKIDVDETRQIVSGLRAARSTGLIAPRAQMWLGRLQLNAGNAKQARASFERALAGGIDEAWLKNELALLLARQGIELERAATLAGEAAAAEPTRADAVDTLGYVHLRSGEAARALEQFRIAVELSEAAEEPRADFHYHLGLALAALGEHQQAAEAFDQALALDPSMQVAAEARAELEASNGEQRVEERS